MLYVTLGNSFPCNCTNLKNSCICGRVLLALWTPLVVVWVPLLVAVGPTCACVGPTCGLVGPDGGLVPVLILFAF